MRIIIVNRAKEAADVFAWKFRDLAEVETHLGSFEEMAAFDCIATAGNSFGLMDAGIETLVLPGFGTGSGGVELLEAATQMHLACGYFLNPPARITPELAQRRHEEVHFGGKYGFEHPRSST